MKIGIIGAGVMGKGVAQRFAQYNHQVVLVDLNDEILSKAQKEIVRNVKMMSMLQKDINADNIVSNISTTTDYADLKDADYIVENVPEIEEVKLEVYKKLEEQCNDGCVYLVNTSCIPITKIGGHTKRPGKVIGVHFMNPVPMKNFSEVICGTYTSEETIENVRELLKSVGISIEVINDSAGFVSNRLSHLFMNEAAFLVYEGVATANQIDNIFKQGFGHKMGPLETADLIGVDTVLESLKVLYDEYEEPKFKACPLLKRMVEAGKLGRKNGKGFYDY